MSGLTMGERVLYVLWSIVAVFAWLFCAIGVLGTVLPGEGYGEWSCGTGIVLCVALLAHIGQLVLGTRAEIRKSAVNRS
jgi:hypothetical protein